MPRPRVTPNTPWPEVPHTLGVSEVCLLVGRCEDVVRGMIREGRLETQQWPGEIRVLKKSLAPHLGYPPESAYDPNLAAQPPVFTPEPAPTVWIARDSCGCLMAVVQSDLNPTALDGVLGRWTREGWRAEEAPCEPGQVFRVGHTCPAKRGRRVA